MAEIVFFKAGEEIEKFADSAIAYITGLRDYIANAASTLGVPQISTAIAGAMAEENDGYNILFDHLLDKYALSGLTAVNLTGITAEVLAGGWTGPLLALLEYHVETSVFPPRTHEQWKDFFEEVDGDAKPGYYDKLTNPVLIDLGLANIKMHTAIRLLIDQNLQTEVSALGLSDYKDDYAKLADDLVNDDNGLAARIYALMIAEADKWYQAHNAYGSDWDNLPQAIKDSLYITYTNIGKGGMEEGWAKGTNNGLMAYEPLPAAGTGGGLNHLYNVQEIAQSMAVTGYGTVSFCDNPVDWVQKAKEENDAGAAYREALFKLRAFVSMDGDYAPEALEKDNFSDRYLEDRCNMLSALISMKYAGIRPDSLNTFVQEDASQSCLFKDVAGNVNVRLGLGKDIICFGNVGSNAIDGDSWTDHLYGMNGNDTLSGGDGGDYLEGGKGQDLMFGGTGNDTFGIVGKDEAYDTFIGGDGTDKIQGGTGDDTIRVHQFDASSSIEQIIGGGGTDIVAGTGEADTIDLSATTLSGIARIEGGEGADTIKGTGAADVLYGGSMEDPDDTAPDRLEGGAGNDEYHIGLADTIKDSDGQGTVWLGNTQLSGITLSEQSETGIYKNENGDIVAFYDPDAKILQVSGQAGTTPLSFNVENFTSGNFGIALAEEAPTDFSRTLTGTDDDDITAATVFQNKGLYYFSGTVSGTQPNLFPGWGEFFMTGPTPPNLKIDGGAGNDMLIGLAGKDTIFGGSGNDLICGEFEWLDDDPARYALVNPWGNIGQTDILMGEAGKDLILAGYGDDIVSGGDDDDFLTGGDGNDTVTGDTGNDAVVGSIGNDKLFGGTGNDLLYGDGFLDTGWITSADIASFNVQMTFAEKGYALSVNLSGNFGIVDIPESGEDQLYGGEGNDMLCGGGGKDVLDGGGDHDTLIGGEGDDRLSGGSGNDWLIGDNGDLTGSGNDTLNGGGGDDLLYGLGGNDTLKGEDGADQLFGFEGDDTLSGGSGNDYLAGDEGSDRLDGGSGSDFLQGGADNDTLDGGSGSDQLEGGAGNDTYLLRRGGGYDLIQDGAGANRLSFDTGIDAAGLSLRPAHYDEGSGQISFSPEGGDLWVEYGQSDGVLLRNGAGNSGFTYQFADGRVLNYSELLALTSQNNNPPAQQPPNPVPPSGSGSSSGGSGSSDWGGNRIPLGPTVMPFGPADYRAREAIIRWLKAHNLWPAEFTDISMASGYENGSVVTGGVVSTGANLFNEPLPPPPEPEGADDYMPNSFYNGSPIILDLDGDGVETRSSAEGIQFDLDNNGFRETVGWVGADDGLLALDRNGDGAITGGTELFGNNTILASGAKAANGFAALAEYDENKDGRIDAGDAVFSQLKIWRDFDADGVSDAGELLSLTDAGVARLNLANTNSTTKDAQGNEHRQLGTYVDANSVSHAMVDVWFDIDPTRTKPVTEVPIPDELKALPEALGYGNVRSLRESMALDATGKLKQLVEQFVAETDAEARRALVPKLMFQWAGGKLAHLDDGYFTDGWGNGNIGCYFRTTITQEEYTVLEAFLGTPKFFNTDGSAIILHNRYQQLEDMVFYQLMAQTHLKDIYRHIDFRYDEASKTWRGDYRQAAIFVTLKAMTAPDKAAGLLTDFLRSVRGMNPYITENTAAVRHEFEEIVKVGWQDQTIQSIATALGTFYLGTGDKAETVYGGQLGDKYTGILFAGGGDDKLYGGIPADLIGGDAGNDTIYGLDGNDILIGGTGDDTLQGSAGDDTYYFRRGDGRDTISNIDDSIGVDTLAFGEGITLASLQLEKAGLDLVIKIGDGDEVKLANWYHPTYAASRLDRFSFADGTVLTRDELLAQRPVLGTAGNDNFSGSSDNEWFDGGAGNDTIAGGAGNDRILGGAGNDSLQGGDGNDELIGGTGDDTLFGGLGDDIFRFNLGDGRDTIQVDDAAGLDTLAFGPGVAPSDLQLIKAGSYDLVLKVGEGDEVKLANWFHPGQLDYRLDRFAFADGTVLTREELLSGRPIYEIGTTAKETLFGYEGADILIGDAGDDTLRGDAGNDILEGGKGNDLLFGGLGDDTFVVGQGEGQDTVYLDDPTGMDTLAFAAGIAPQDIQLRKVGNDLAIKVGNGGHQVKVLDWFYTGMAGYRLDRFTFTDGTVWDAATLGSLTASLANNIAPTKTSELSLGEIGEEGTLVIAETTLLANWNDGDNDSLNVVKLSVNTGTLVDNGDGTWSYTSARDFSGNVVFSYTVTDGFANMAVQANLTVTSVNDAPTVAGKAILGSMNTGGSRLITSSQLLATAIDADGDALAVTGLVADTGTLVDNNDGTWLYTPEAQFGGTAQFSYQVTDGKTPVLARARIDVSMGLNDIIGTATDNSLQGTAAGDHLDGLAGNDNLFGRDGNDILAGGTGNDSLTGGAGDDTFRFNLGDSQDTIALDDGPGVNTLSFGEGITPGELILFKDTYDLLIDVGTHGDQVRLPSWFYSTSLRLDRFSFADGTVLTWEELGALRPVHLQGGESADNFQGSELGDIIEGGTGSDSLSGIDGADLLRGGNGDDSLIAGNGNDSLYGDAGDDRLFGGAGDDILKGGAGNDLLQGGSGNDFFHFGFGDGVDTIEADDAEGIDTLVFGTGIAAADLRLASSGYDLLVTVGETGDQIRLLNWMNSSYAGQRIDRFVFADGTELTSLELVSLHPVLVQGTESHDVNIFGHEGKDRIFGGAGYDYLSGYGGDDLLDGGSGNDQLHGGAGNDIFIGGAGYDHLHGDAGDDTFLFNRGSGYDVIFLDDSAGNNTLVFGEGIGVDDLSLEKYQSLNLAIKIGDGDDRAILTSWFDSNNIEARINRFVFADGTELDYDTLQRLKPIHVLGDDTPNYMYGHEGTDIVEGGKGDDLLQSLAGNDVLIGGAGSDTLYGGAGDDIFRYNRGDGQDTIQLDDKNGLDTLAFGEGVGLSDLWLQKIGSYDLAINMGESNDQVKLANWFNAAYTGYRLGLSFVGGTTSTVTELLAANPVYSLGQPTNDSLLGLEGVDIVIGNAGNDSLWGYAGNDSLQGGSGDDAIYGGDGNDLLIGGTGSDTLYGGQGDDTFSFNLGDGQDILYLDDINGTDTLAFGAGITLNDLQLQKIGGNDLIIKVGQGNDQVKVVNWFHPSYTGHRLDRFTFADGTALSLAELLAAKPVLSLGTAANDSLSGHEGVDFMTGEAGNDTLSGNVGNDRLTGGDGGDTLYGGEGNDLLIGGTGNDSLSGGAGDDTFYFNLGDGQDTIQLDDINGIDTLAFGEGISLADLQLHKIGAYDLTISVGNAGDQVKLAYWFHPSYPGYRLDRFTFADGTALTLTELLAAKPVNSLGTAANDSLQGHEGVDNISGDAGNDSLSGYGGNDILAGGQGADTLNGGDGNDMLIGGTGNDSLSGGYGNDIFTFNLGDGQDTIQLDDINGMDTLAFGEGISLADLQLQKVGAYDLTINVGGTGDQVKLAYWFHPSYPGYRLDRFTFADGTVMTLTELLAAEPVNSLGTAANDSLLGHEGVDNISGDAGNDSLSGYGGNDTLTGGQGADTLNGGDGNDMLIGGTGNDSLSGGYGDDIFTFNLGDGQDIINLDDINGIDALAFGEGIHLADLQLQKIGSYDLAINVGGTGDQVKLVNWFHPSYPGYRLDRFTFADGTVMTLTELLAAKPVYSLGTAANDSLLGHEGVDNISGDAGNDSLSGYAGDDRLSGGEGSDTLTGGAGNDTFVFDTFLNQSTNKDSITDFVSGVDKIELDQSIFNALPAEGTLASYFQANATGTAADDNDYILYNTTAGSLLYDADGNGQGVAIEFATLTNKPAIKAEDFIIAS